MEYLKHLLIRTPLHRPLSTLRDCTTLYKRLRHPELAEVYREPRRIEHMMRRIIQSDWNCLDIGSHLGAVLLRFIRLAPQGQHYAFEAIPRKAEWLRRKFPEAHVVHAALSDGTGEVEFFQNIRHSGYSGLKPHESHAGEQFRRFTVPCRRLDDVLPADYRVNFIKIDVEGAELKVLRGGQAVLERHHPVILFECTRSGLAQHAITADDMFGFFASAGYGVFTVQDWLCKGRPLSRTSFSDAMAYPFRALNFVAV